MERGLAPPMQALSESPGGLLSRQFVRPARPGEAVQYRRTTVSAGGRVSSGRG